MTLAASTSLLLSALQASAVRGDRFTPSDRVVLCEAAAGAKGERLKERYDVVVVGAGTGGVAAALQAARLGASVLLVEPSDWIGGQMSAAGVTSMDEGYPPRGRVRDRGIYGEFYRRTSAFYQAIGKSTDTCAVSEDHFAVEPHVAQRILYDMIRDVRATPLAGDKAVVLDILLRTTATSVLREGRTIRGVTLGIHGRGSSPIEKSVRSRVLIDATEYGDVIPLTGAPYRIGISLVDGDTQSAEENPPVQPITWTASIKHYPNGLPDELLMTEPPRNYNEKQIKPSLCLSGSGNSELPWTWERFLKYRGMPDSTSPFSAHNGSGLVLTRTHINFGPNDQSFTVLDVENHEHRGEAEYHARLKTLGVIYYFQHAMGIDDWSVADDVGYDSPHNRRQIDELVQRHPDLAPHRRILEHFPVIPYVRESRRIVGVYTLRAADIRRKKPYHPVRFHHSVAIGDYPVDLHHEHDRRESQVELELDEPADLPERWIQWGYGPFQIPFESFIPAELDGFLPAEKNLSQSRIASGATRLQPSTMLTGQAAGAIAGLAALNDRQPRELPPLMVQKALLDAGSTLSPTYYPDVPHGTELWKAVQLATLYEVLDYAESEFNGTARATEPEVAMVNERLSDVLASIADATDKEPTSFNVKAATREELAREVSRTLLATIENVEVNREN